MSNTDKAVIVDEQVVELDSEVVALVAAMLAPGRDCDLVEAPLDTWERARCVFPSSKAPAADADGFTRILGA